MTLPAANTVYLGDALATLRGWPDVFVDAIITDPPYGLRFMGQKWDYDVPGVELWAECLRVLKDGGRLLAFSGSRTSHRMVCNIEDAGFTIEDGIMWLYGQGFPKHKSKMKPAYEPICIARKGAVTDLNIDAGRIGSSKDVPASPKQMPASTHTVSLPGGKYTDSGFDPNIGRWPANVCLDPAAAELLDQQSGTLTSGALRVNQVEDVFDGVHDGYRRKNRSAYTHKIVGQVRNMGDSGGASRFFYTAKASRGEREAGCEHLPPADSRKWSERTDGNGGTRDYYPDGTPRPQTKPLANNHPTVKPIALMRWLVRLFSFPGETVADPFCGSGTTLIACALEDRPYLGIDMEPRWVDIARARVAHWSEQRQAEEAKQRAAEAQAQLFGE